MIPLFKLAVIISRIYDKFIWFLLYECLQAWKLWNEEKIVNLMDPLIHDSRMEKEILRYANVGLLCVEEIHKYRPNISTVLSMLNKEIVDLPHPMQPAFTLNLRYPEAYKPSIKCSSNDVTLTIIEGR